MDDVITKDDAIAKLVNLEVPETNVDELSNKIKNKTHDESFDHSEKQKKDIQSVASNHIKTDSWVKYGVLILLIIYIFWQTWTIHSFVSQEILLSPDHRLEASVVITYIKYSLGFNTALLLILGYWYGNNGGFNKLMEKALGSIFDNKYVEKNKNK